MPIICLKKYINIENFTQKVSFAFNCRYDKDNYYLELKNQEDNYFDSHTFREKIDLVTNNLTPQILKEYEKNTPRYLAVSRYYYDNIPQLYSIKF